VLIAAAVAGRRGLARIALAAFAIYAVPHTIFHGLHLADFSIVDAAAQMSGFAAQLVLVVGVVRSGSWPRVSGGVDVADRYCRGTAAENRSADHPGWWLPAATSRSRSSTQHNPAHRTSALS
jgi:hypothetical protein